MELLTRANLIIAAAIITLGLAGGMIGSAALASRAYVSRSERDDNREQTLSVTGSARRRITSDLGIWRATISGNGKTLKDAYAALQPAVERVGAFLKSRGFTEKEISSGAIETNTNYGRNEKGERTDEIVGYTLLRAYTVSSTNVAAIGTAASEVTDLIRDGIAVVSSAPEYHYTKLSDLKIEMIGLAAKDARMRADQIASNAGSTVAGVRNARMGVLQITRPESTEVSDDGINDTSTVEKDVTAVVALTMRLEKQ
jgi:uncharacterized protein